MMRGAQTQHLLPGSGNKTKMPSDKPNQQYNNNSPLASRPLMPALSASAKVGRPPLTPRIAGSATSTRSPILRRGTGAPAAETTPKSTPKDGIATPVKAFLSSNITPRSSSRKARADSAGNTPNGTPNGTPSNSRPTSTIDATSLLGDGGLDAEAGLGIGGLGDGDATKFVVADGSANPYQSPLGNNWPNFSDEQSNRDASSDAGAADPSPMFFFASDVKSSPTAAKLPPQRPDLLKKTSSFFYANDQSASGQTGASAVQSPSSATDSSQGKFFQIRTASVPKANTAVPGSFRAHSPASAPKRAAMAPRQATFSPTNPSWQSQQPHRSPSPSRDNQPSGFPTLKASPAPGSPRSIRPMPQPMAVARSPSTSSTASRTAMNRGPTASPTKAPTPATSPHRQVSHKRSISMASLEASPPITAQPPPISGLASFGTPSEEPEADPISPPTTYALASPSAMFPITTTAPTSPTKSSHADPAATSAAHQARRERKVLDLEISNSSLLAINRTLEREMRKQNAELRRFRRLSRAGRLSLASHTRHSTATATTDTLSDISDVSGLSSDEDEDDYLSSTSSSPTSLSPGANSARRMLKDETRLKLDLQKHQQLLVDSQKMNQSLKRCLGWTEELIQDGRKALEYTVRVSEVEVGGRVLVPEEVEDEDEDENGQEVDRVDAGETAVDVDAAARLAIDPSTEEEQRVAQDAEVCS